MTGNIKQENTAGAETTDENLQPCGSRKHRRFVSKGETIMGSAFLLFQSEFQPSHCIMTLNGVRKFVALS